jgi:hypothetical protein
MTANSGNTCQQDRNSVVCYDGNRTETHGPHKKRAAAIRHILRYKADNICKYLLHTVFPIATAPIHLIGFSIICL